MTAGRLERICQKRYGCFASQRIIQQLPEPGLPICCKHRNSQLSCSTKCPGSTGRITGYVYHKPGNSREHVAQLHQIHYTISVTICFEVAPIIHQSSGQLPVNLRSRPVSGLLTFTVQVNNGTYFPADTCWMKETHRNGWNHSCGMGGNICNNGVSGQLTIPELQRRLILSH